MLSTLAFTLPAFAISFKLVKAAANDQCNIEKDTLAVHSIRKWCAAIWRITLVIDHASDSS